MLRVVEKWCRTKETTLGEAEEVEVPHDPSQRGNSFKLIDLSMIETRT
jgi:hypothetical protein